LPLFERQAEISARARGCSRSQVAGAFAEFEFTMIRQRVKAGLKRAVAQGVKLGRPKIDRATERKVRRLLAKGVGILKVVKSLDIGTGTVQRISNELGRRKALPAGGH
jgi:DNA invertase Pin-like site-specific DNA recombinase